MDQLRIWMTRSFWAGAALTLVAVLTLLTLALITAIGDRSLASGVWGVLAVTLVAWVLNFITLVGMLAWRAIHDGDKKN